MRTVIVGEPPHELATWLEQRETLGQDRFDDVWEGEYHVAPAPRWQHVRVEFQLVRILGPLADAVGLVGSSGVSIGDAGDFRRIDWP